VALGFDRPARDDVNAVCPLRCRLRYGANPPGDPGPTGAEVDWAGLPIDLDLAFSQQQRDKVYVQHLMRKRGAQLWPALPASAQLCVCEAAADNEHLDPDAAQDYVSS
jgi:hypothetical protein